MRAFFAKFVTAIFGAGLLMTATAAMACNTGCAPPAPPVRPTPPTPPSMPCNCNGGGSNSSGSASANVNVNVNVNANVSGSASAAVFGFGFGQGSVSSGGYSNWSQTPSPVENAGGLNIETGAAAMDMIAEKRTVTRTLVIQASCIDDTGVPHPASQLGPDRAIANDYMGEVYRCIAGTHMQVTMADFGICDDFGAPAGDVRIGERETSSYSRTESHSGSGYDQGYGMPAGPCAPQALACSGSAGGGYAADEESHDQRSLVSGPQRGGCATRDFSHVNFDGGKTMTCQKGDALWFERGNLSCKVQIQQRQCNERSLLRRFGVGIKVLTVTQIETMQRQVARQVERSSSSTTVMTFNGGVGGFVE